MTKTAPGAYRTAVLANQDSSPGFTPETVRNTGKAWKTLKGAAASVAEDIGADVTNAAGNALGGMKQLNRMGYKADSQYRSKLETARNAIAYNRGLMEKERKAGTLTAKKKARYLENIRSYQYDLDHADDLLKFSDEQTEKAQKQAYKKSDKLTAQYQQHIVNAKKGMNTAGKVLVDAGSGLAKMGVEGVLGAPGLAAGAYASGTRQARQTGASRKGQEAAGVLSALGTLAGSAAAGALGGKASTAYLLDKGIPQKWAKLVQSGASGMAFGGVSAAGEELGRKAAGGKNYRTNWAEVGKQAMIGAVYGALNQVVHAAVQGKTDAGKAAERPRSDWFDGCATPEEVRARLRQLAKTNHPDVSISGDSMAGINASAREVMDWMKRQSVETVADAYRQGAADAQTRERVNDALSVLREAVAEDGDAGAELLRGIHAMAEDLDAAGMKKSTPAGAGQLKVVPEGGTVDPTTARVQKDIAMKSNGVEANRIFNETGLLQTNDGRWHDGVGGPVVGDAGNDVHGNPEFLEAGEAIGGIKAEKENGRGTGENSYGNLEHGKDWENVGESARSGLVNPASGAADSQKVSDRQSAVTILRNNVDSLQKMRSVVSITGNEIGHEGRATDNAMKFLEKIGNRVFRPNFGEVLFSRSKLKNSLVGHGFGQAKVDLVAALPNVIGMGAKIAETPNWKGRGYDSFVFAAPVTYKGRQIFVDAIVIRDSANRYYLHEAVDSDGNVILGSEKSPDTASDRPLNNAGDTVADTELSSANIAQRGREVNPVSSTENDAPPEQVREPIGDADIQEFWKLCQDTANPITDSREREAEAREYADSLVSEATPPQKKTLREGAAETRSYLMRKMVDSADSVRRMEKLTGDSNLYDYYNMARASASAGVHMIAGEQTDVSGRPVGPGLNAILKPVMNSGNYREFQLYLLHLHNIDRMSIVGEKNAAAKMEAEAALADFDREHPEMVTKTEGQLRRKADSLDPDVSALARERMQLLRKIDAAEKLGNKPVFSYEVSADTSREESDRLLREHPEFAEYQKQVRGYIHNLMQYRVDSGLMTPEDMAYLEKYYPNYVPTKRVQEKTDSRVARKSVKIGKTVGRAEGGDSQLMPFHEALGKQTMAVVREGSKNRFGQRLLSNWEENPGAVKKYISDAKAFDGGFDPDSLDMLETDPKFQKSNTFFVYRGGKLWEMAVDPSMYEAVKTLAPDSQEMTGWTKAVRGANSLFKELVTGYNPMFLGRNVIRDAQTAGLYSRDFGKWAQNYPLALKEIASGGQFWKQYQALGGVYSSVFDYRTGTVKEPDAKIQKVMGRMEALNMAMEQAPRLAEFMSVVKSGDGSMDNLMDAMHAAADVTVNFGQSGSIGKVLNANYVPFLNPGIQGFDRMVRRATETRGGKAWAKLVLRVAALGVAPALLNELLYKDDSDWKDLRQSDKDTNYLFKIGKGLWLKIPKGRELSVLGMTGQRAAQLAQGKTVDWRDYFVTTANQVAPANPLKTNIISPAIDAALLNSKNPGTTWYGGDIEGQRLRGYAPGQRYDSSTDLFSKWLGGQLNLSPKKINYILDQYSGVLGDFVLPMMTPQKLTPQSVAKALAVNGFVKAFTVDSVSNNHISEDFYAQGDKITYAKNGGDTSMQAVSRFWNRQVTACGKIYAQIREIENSKSLTDKEKRQKVREAKAVLNGIQKNALATVGDYQKAVKRNMKGSGTEAVDRAYREANRECFGAEYALRTYSGDVYEKARNAHANGVDYGDYYRYYFDTKRLESRGGKSAATQKMEYLEKSSLSGSAKAEIYFADLASDSDLTRQAELENSAKISPEQYWNYKVATNGLHRKAEKLRAIDGLKLSFAQKTALYYANGYARSTVSDAPWVSGARTRYDIMPKLTGTTGHRLTKADLPAGW